MLLSVSNFQKIQYRKIIPSNELLRKLAYEFFKNIKTEFKKDMIVFKSTNYYIMVTNKILLKLPKNIFKISGHTNLVIRCK